MRSAFNAEVHSSPTPQGAANAKALGQEREAALRNSEEARGEQREMSLES